MLNNLKEEIEKYNFFIKKGYGQNFLIDKGMIKKIVEGASLPPFSVVLEIGPGFGSLTTVLSDISQKLICVEIDRSLASILESYNLENTEIINKDFLKIDLEELLVPYEEVHVVANLPYYISTAIIMKLIHPKIKSMTLMMQKEVADRFKASKNSKEYGSLTLAINYYMNVSKIANVPSGCFYPRPAVESCVVRLEKKETQFQTDVDSLFDLIKKSFANRRKTMVNSLHLSDFSFSKEEVINAMLKAGIKENARAEDLEISDYVLINNTLSLD